MHNEAEDNGIRDPEVARAEASIAKTRERVATSMLALRHEVSRRTDWREWVRERPTVFVGGAFLLGLAIGSRR